MAERIETRDQTPGRYASGVQTVETALAGLAEADLDLARTKKSGPFAL